jgi:16S rRNA (uracil1498-N3)-methyltransferase
MSEQDAWFYCDGVFGEGKGFELPLAEATHLVRSRRLRVGALVTIFDGFGNTAVAEVGELESRPVRAMLYVRARTMRPPPTRQIHLVCALPKGDRQSVLIDMVTQLGVTDFTPLRCERSVAGQGRRSVERWQRLMLEACKQSRRAWLPRLHAETSLTEVVEDKGLEGYTRLVADPSGVSINEFDSAQLGKTNLSLLVGPEGGFSDTETVILRSSNVLPVRLGDGILRIETAAVALVTLVGAM